MENRWVLHVQNFAKIKNAEIELAPFTLFVGDNNSGKSYLLSLIWGLLSLDNVILFDGLSDLKSKNYRKCYKWLETTCNNAILDSNRITEKIDNATLSNFYGLINECLDRNKMQIVSTIFNSEVEIEKLYIKFPDTNNITLGLLKRIQMKNSINEQEEHIFIFFKNESNLEKNIMTGISLKAREQVLDIDLGLRYIMASLLKNEYSQHIGDSIAFLPASRTGFLLTYKLLTTRAIENIFDDLPIEKNILTKPLNSFLSRLASISTDDSKKKLYYEMFKYKDLDQIVSFIEEMILDGKINLIDLPSVADIKYKPNGVEKDFPMYLTSSVITELTPLTLFLKYQKGFQTLMMEEPEMCLHPKLQWYIARVLIKLVNIGMPVFITTHSDTILQHINNMIKLQNNSNREELAEEYRYQENDLININDIRMYQFDVDNNTHKTIVSKLESNKNGFSIPSFEKTLKHLLDEVWSFQEEE